MPSPLTIAMALLLAVQSVASALGGGEALCLGGGHEHPPDALVTSCVSDCGHAAGRTPLPAPVGDTHPDCECVDIDISATEFLAGHQRVEVLAPAPAFTTPGPLGNRVHDARLLPRVADPGLIQQAAALATVRLLV